MRAFIRKALLFQKSNTKHHHHTEEEEVNEEAKKRLPNPPLLPVI